MVSLDYLKQLILLLKANQVTHFKNEGLELTLDRSSKSQSIDQEPGPRLADSDVKELMNMLPDESKLPPDLRTDNITSEDVILNWSTTPDPNDLGDETMPGANDFSLGQL